MLISYKWLGSYFDTAIPSAEETARLFNVHFAEVEAVEEKDGDTVFDISITPDRACYALSHCGIARELSAIAKLAIAPHKKREFAVDETCTVMVNNDAADFAKRYALRRIENISNGTSPEWLRGYLTAVGERSINTVVDITNFIMLDTGQPLHAFDADKVVGSIVVRPAKDGERITLLDGNEVTLSSKDHVIADDEGPLAIAGVKGGNRASVTEATRNILLEAAHFDAVAVRKTARSVKISNNSSKRFENGIDISLVSFGMDRATDLFVDIFGSAIRIGRVHDQYEENQEKHVAVSLSHINEVLGSALDKKEVKKLLACLNITVVEKDDVFDCTLPLYRCDLSIEEDIVEEIGRLIGFDSIEGVLPPDTQQSEARALFYTVFALKEMLVTSGFSEIITSTFRDHGDRLVQNPVASDKNFLRTDLRESCLEALKRGVYYADLLGTASIRVFEIGKVFSEDKESLRLCIGIAQKGKESVVAEALDDTIAKIRDFFAEGILETKLQDGNIKYQGDKWNFEVEEIPFTSDALKHHSIEQSIIDAYVEKLNTAHYQKPSIYPFITRDIAFWAPESADIAAIEALMREEAGNLLLRLVCFDTFKKDDRVSRAFRLVFQAGDRTLTDDEINVIMKKITERIESAGDDFAVR